MKTPKDFKSLSRVLQPTSALLSLPVLGIRASPSRFRNIKSFHNLLPTSTLFSTIPTMKAVVFRGKEAHVERDRPAPKLRDDYLLVKTVAVALNPTDWKHVTGGLPAEGGLVGCDFSGVVEEVGSAVTKHWSKGDRICGVAHGGNSLQPEDGAFAEYIVAKGDIQMKIPNKMSFEQAATIGLGATTVGQGLYQQALKLNLPTDPVKQKTYILIYGGSSATGALGVQYAKL